MDRRIRAALVTLLLAAPAAADTFGGFSGVDRPYLVDQDKVCKPIKVTGGVAKGAASCEKAGADVVAKLSVKDPIPQRGPKATFAATAAGRKLTVTRKTGEPVVTWEAIDPIAKVVEVYGSQYDDRVAVAFTTRRMGKEVTDIVAFDLLEKGTTPTPPTTPPTTPTTPTTPVPTEDPKVTKAVADARKVAVGAKAIAAWDKVIALDAQHSEATYKIAASHAAAKQPADAMTKLAALAASTRADAIEWLIEARFDPAFAGLRADAKFRSTVGIDKKPTSVYERLMYFGGQWEQTGTSCDKPEVRLVMSRDRTFKLMVKTNCSGRIYETPFKGQWRVDAAGVVLMLPNKGKVTAADEAPCVFEPVGDEDSLRCNIGKDLEFVVLPARR